MRTHLKSQALTESVEASVALDRGVTVTAEELANENVRLRQELEAALRDRDQWKANHDSQVQVKRRGKDALKTHLESRITILTEMVREWTDAKVDLAYQPIPSAFDHMTATEVELLYSRKRQRLRIAEKALLDYAKANKLIEERE